jgi:hypothetical protein
MTPAVGATANAAKQNTNQDTYFAKSPQLPATEINNAEENTEINDNPKFFDQPKPVHSYVAATLFQAGTVNDPIRGSITSSSQRESPSAAQGISTPGRPVYQGGLKDETIKQQVSSGSVKLEDVNVVGRKGGHSVVLDDGDVSGKNSLIRIRTAKGHQVTMSDDGNCFYFAHANGQVWLEFGQEGTFDLYTTNSVNIRSEGTVNIHADKDINMYAGGNIAMMSNVAMTIQSQKSFTIASKDKIALFSELGISVKSNGTLAFNSKVGTWKTGGGLAFDGATVDLNSGIAGSLSAPTGLVEYTMPGSKFNTATGFVVDGEGLKSIVTRAPSHEPWPYHNQGVRTNVNLSDGNNSSPPGAPTVPTGTSITKTN